uniref:NADH dehydrogenase subunit 4L n=1 Tax=Paracyclopina nana TaxID=565004 RepID=C0J6R6_PARNA|nr:NADH dehydrogenase subunit 4L [Paracyclopina nana]
MIWSSSTTYWLMTFGVTAVKLCSLIMLVSALTLIFIRTHYFIFLLMIELMFMGFYWFMAEMILISGFPQNYLFFFMIVMVMGACLGMGFLVMLTRVFSKSMELFYMMV